MQRHIRIGACVALAIGAITCSESTSPTGPKATGPVRLTVSPRFSAEAARAYSALAAGGIVVTEVHVHLTAPDGSARDSLINFPPSLSQLLVEIPVSAGQDGQPFTVLVELRNDAHTVLFSGTQTVVAHSAQFSGATPPDFVVQYAGPGKGAATVTVSPANPTTSSTATMPFTATAVDAAGRAVADLLVLWTSSDATIATVTSTGDATALVGGLGKRGVATITATTPLGVFGASRLTFVPPPARLVVVSGGGQTGVAGSALPQPFVVEVQASDNLPVSGAPVTFRSVTMGGSVQQTTAVADANGRASTVLTLGRTAGVYQFEATSGSLTAVSVSATATAAPPAALAIVSGNGQSNSAGLSLAQPLVVAVTDQFGAPVTGAAVTWTRLTGTGVLGATVSVSDVNGLASIAYTLGSAVGTESVQASLPGVSASAGMVLFTMTAVSRVPTAITIISGGGQSGAPGTVLPTPLVAMVTDVAGNGVPSVSVTWGSSANGATFAPGTSTTGANGQVSTTATLGSTPGSVLVSATAGALAANTTLTITGSLVRKFVVVAGPPTSITVGAAISSPIQVQVVDANNNPILLAGINVALDVNVQPSNTTISQATTTNASGIATFALATYIGAIGTANFTVTVGTFSQVINPSPIPVLTGAATHLVISLQPSPIATSGIPLAQQPAVRFADAGNNFLGQAGLSVTASIGSGGGTLGGTVTVGQGSTGTATFTNLSITGASGARTLTFTSGALPPVTSNPITLGTSAATQLIITTQPSAAAQAGVLFTTQPVIQLADANGNAVAQAGVNVSADIVNPGGQTSLTGSVTILTNASGVASYTDLAIAGPIGTRTLQFTSGTLSPVVSGNIAVNAGPPAQLFVFTNTSSIAVSGVPLAPQPGIQVQDAFGNPVLTAGIVVTASIQNGTGTLSNTTAATNASGVATFSGLTITGTAGLIDVRFDAPGTTPVFLGIIVDAGALASITVTPNPATLNIGTTQQFTAVGLDASNNVVSIAPTWSVVNGGGTITAGGLLTAGTSTGTFANTVKATSGAISGAATVTVTAGLATHLAFVTSPSATATNGAALASQPALQLRDALNKPVPTQGVIVSATITSGTGVLTNANAVTDASGTATFVGLAITGTAGNFNLSFTTGALTPLPFGPIALSAGTATQLVFATLPVPTAQVGVVFTPQPAIQLADVSGNPVSQAGVNVTGVIASGGGTLNGATSVNTNASGLASFTNLAITGTVGVRTLRFQSGSLSSLVSPAINVTLGPGSQLTFTTAPASSATSGTPLAPQPVLQLRDAGGNAVLTPGVLVTATIASGSGSLTNATATSVSNGSVTFAGLTITGTAGSFVLQFAASGYTPLSSGPIVVSGGGNTLITKAGRRLSVDAVGVTSPSISPIFVARNGAGAPLNNQTVTLTASGRCRLIDALNNRVTILNYGSDVNGEVFPNVELPTGADGAGCVIRATGSTFTTATDSAMLAVYPVGTTHIWVGGTSTDWSTAANWIAPGTVAVAAAPGAADQAFLPFYVGIFNQPKLSTSTTVRKLALDTAASLDINQTLLNIGNLGVTGLGVIQNGRAKLIASASLAGIFDRVEIGQTGSCGGFMGTLANMVANTLDLFCAAKIDTTFAHILTDLTVHPNGGALSLTQVSAQLLVGGNAQFTGDSLYTNGGNIFVTGAATFGGTKVNVNGGLFNLLAGATFQAAAATYTNTIFSTAGTVSFGGGSAGVQLFSGGTLLVSGDFSQIPGSLSLATFTTNNDHLTEFTGAVTQTISFANTQSFFSRLLLQNSSPGGVVVLDRAQTIDGTTQPRVSLLSGKLTLNPAAVFSALGSVVLGPSSNLNLLGTSNFQSSNCTGRTTNGATITGTGNFNGAPYTAATCTP